MKVETFHVGFELFDLYGFELLEAVAWVVFLACLVFIAVKVLNGSV